MLHWLQTADPDHIAAAACGAVAVVWALAATIMWVVSGSTIDDNE